MSNLPVPFEKIIESGQFASFDEQVIRACEAGPGNLRIYQLDYNGLRDFGKSIIKVANVKLSSKLKEPGPYKDMLDQICTDLKKKFATYTVAEILFAVDAGLDGDFRSSEDSMVYFSPSNLIIWIRKWVELVKTPVMKKVSNVYTSVGPGTEMKALPVDMKTKLNSSFEILYYALQKVSAGAAFVDGGNHLWNLLRITDMDFKELGQNYYDGSTAELTDTEKRKAVTDKLILVVSQGPDGCKEYLEHTRTEILKYLSNPQ